MSEYSKLIGRTCAVQCLMSTYVGAEWLEDLDSGDVVIPIYITEHSVPEACLLTKYGIRKIFMNSSRLKRI